MLLHIYVCELQTADEGFLCTLNVDDQFLLEKAVYSAWPGSAHQLQYKAQPVILNSTCFFIRTVTYFSHYIIDMPKYYFMVHSKFLVPS